MNVLLSSDINDTSANLAVLSNAMDAEIERVGGIDAAMKAADLVYRSTYKSSETYSVLEAGYTLEEYIYDFTEQFVSNLADQRLSASGYNVEQSTWSYNDEDEDYSDQMSQANECACYEIEDEIEAGTLVLPIITLETRLVDLCNYKGEAEGIPMPADLVTSLSTFHGKYNYS